MTSQGKKFTIGHKVINTATIIHLFHWCNVMLLLHMARMWIPLQVFLNGYWYVYTDKFQLPLLNGVPNCVLMILIPLYAAGSDLTSLSFPFSFPLSTDGGSFGKACRVLKLFPLFLK